MKGGGSKEDHKYSGFAFCSREKLLIILLSVMLGGVDAAWRQRSNGKRTPGGAALPPLSYPPPSTDIKTSH